MKTSEAAARRAQGVNAGMYGDEGDNPFADVVEQIKALTALEWLDLSPTALTINAELSEDEWFILIEKIESLRHRYQWYLGDAMVYGIDRKYGETEAQIQRLMKITRKGKSTLNDYYKTALLFEIHERSQNLKFEQHRVLAIEFSQQTPEHHSERLRWLHVAETEGLSGRKLQTAIAAQLPAITTPDDELARLQAGMPGGVIIERVDVDPPAPLPRKLPVSATDPVNRKRMNKLWKKVETATPFTSEDRGEVWMLRLWCDELLNTFDEDK